MATRSRSSPGGIADVCWPRGTATLMILGDRWTRRCGFCNVTAGKPTWTDPLEPARIAREQAAKCMVGVRTPDFR